jgi:hypothetical protein
MPMRLSPALLLCALALPLGAAETVPPAAAVTAATDAPEVPKSEPSAISPDLLREALPKSTALVSADGKLWWDDGKGTKLPFALVACGQGNPWLDTPIGRLAVDRKLLTDDHVSVIAQVMPLVNLAKAAGLSADGFTVREGILTGIHLRSDQTLVLNEGVATKVDSEPPKRVAEREQLDTAVKEVEAVLPTTQLDDLGRKTVIDVLDRLNSEDGKQAVDEVAPSFARRIVRFDWLDVFLNGHDKAKSLVTAINTANRFLPTVRFEGKGIRLAEVQNAFGQGGWILTTPTRSAYTRLHAEPLYHWAMQPMNLVVELPVSADPTTFPDIGVEPLGAKLYRNGQQIVSWTNGGAFQVDKALWREAVPDDRHRQGVDRNATTDFMPPHIVISGFDGDVAGIATAGGWLAAPKAEPKDYERFLSQAAAQLPDAAHLDLIGEYILTYCYDSPDSRFPWLIGTKQIKGDIHQTAAQTLATATGGVVRGDCDDLAELYEVIARRQGRTSIVLALPQHAAASWAEKQTDGKWHVFVLQTGPAVEFTDAALPKALEAAYKSFGASETFDPNGLSLLLRFSDENTRSSWRLSYRIFAEPDYYKTMVEVQKDWHYQTYQRGIQTMKDLIAKGDQDTANYRELSGLYSFTGQYQLAAEYHQKALDLTEEPEGKFLMGIELLGHLFASKQDAKAKDLAKDLLEVQFPRIKAKMGPSAWSSGMELVAVLEGHHALDLALQAQETMLIEPLSDQYGSLAEKIEQLAGYVQSPKYNQQTWENSSQFLELRNLTAQYAGICIGLVAEAGPDRLAHEETLRSAAHAAEIWLTHLAFHDVEEPGEAPMRYASAGRYYATILGRERFDQILATAALPTDKDVTGMDHTNRIGGLAQLALDLPWIRLSVPYWLGRLQELFARDHQTIDRVEVARLASALDEAYAVGTKLGIEDPQIEFDAHLGKLIAALMANDLATVKRRLQYVAEKNDKRLRDDTAQWIGDIARFIPIEQFGSVIDAWGDIVGGGKQDNAKQKYFWIAWRAALGGATQHALLAASMAATRYRTDAAFDEEQKFMQTLFEPTATPTAK